VNTGAGNFVVRDGRIQYGMEAIKGVGSHAVEQLVEEREENGSFSSIFDFTGRVDLRSCNRKTIESLITAGAFDSIHSNRAQLMESLDDALQYGQRKQQDEQLNQISLFEAGGNGSVIPEPSLREAQPWTNIERLKKERELIGFYLSGHPLDKFKDDISLFCSQQLLAETLEELDDRTPVTCAGIITSVKRVTDRKGRPFAFLTMEDEVGSIEVIAFSNTFDKFMNLLVTDNIVVVDGVTDSRSGSVKIIANSFDRIENLREKNADKIRLHINLRTESLVKEDFDAISELFSVHRGNTPITMDVFSPHANKPLRMNVRKYVIDPSEDMLRDLRKVIGRDNVNLERV
jgi:DNA polymerase-3 subunit alpha